MYFCPLLRLCSWNERAAQLAALLQVPPQGCPACLLMISTRRNEAGTGPFQYALAVAAWPCMGPSLGAQPKACLQRQHSAQPRLLRAPAACMLSRGAWAAA